MYRIILLVWRRLYMQVLKSTTNVYTALNKPVCTSVYETKTSWSDLIFRCSIHTLSLTRYKEKLQNLHVTVRGCLSYVWFGNIADTEICMLPLLNLLIHAPASDENAQLTVKVIAEEGWIPATDISWHPTNHEFLWPAGYGGVVYFVVNSALQFKIWFILVYSQTITVNI